jgi:methylphosphotriester-DNA--protein-cysteine methyltransferase
MTIRKTACLILIGCLLIFIPFSVCSEEDKYVASKFSVQYHLSTCKKAKRIQIQNRVTFDSAEKAVNAGYLPCGKCKPPAKD